ncbi:unnamed protein product [Victoria cruziana]
MEEANSAHGSAPKAPPPAPPPAQNPAPPPGVYTPTRKKRKFDDAEFQASKYCKIRSILKGLRPSIIDVLRSNDYRINKCADTIRKDLRLIMELSKQLRAETVSLGKMRRFETMEDNSDRRQEEKITGKTSLEKPPPEQKVAVNEETVLKKGVASESYLIGGSPDARNFITYPGSDPVYYGKAKASAAERQEPAQS